MKQALLAALPAFALASGLMMAAPAFAQTAAEKTEKTETKKKDAGSDERAVYIYDAIDADMAREVNKRLRELSAKDQKAEIQIYINSLGGSVTDGMSMYDTIQAIPNPVRTICEGKAGSMAGYLLMSGSPGLRIMQKNCEFMIHQPSNKNEGTASSHEINAANMAKTRLQLETLTATHSGWPLETVRAMMNNGDLLLDASDAVKMNFADAVIPYAKTPRAPDKAPTLPDQFCNGQRTYNLLCQKPGMGKPATASMTPQ